VLISIKEARKAHIERHDTHLFFIQLTHEIIIAARSRSMPRTLDLSDLGIFFKRNSDIKLFLISKFFSALAKSRLYMSLFFRVVYT
jgi:hypothetical protein